MNGAEGHHTAVSPREMMAALTQYEAELLVATTDAQRHARQARRYAFLAAALCVPYLSAVVWLIIT